MLAVTLSQLPLGKYTGVAKLILSVAVGERRLARLLNSDANERQPPAIFAVSGSVLPLILSKLMRGEGLNKIQSSTPI